MRHPLFLIAFVFTLRPLCADEAALPPDHGFPAARYEALWTKSPFAVASAEDNGAAASPDYAMVGAAQIEGVSYVNLIEKQSGNHFLLASDAPSHGLTLVSVNRGKDAASTYAIVNRGGQSLHLKFEQGAVPPPAQVAGVAPAIAPPPGVAATGGPSTSAVYQPPVAVLPSVGSQAPRVHFRRKVIPIPPPPPGQTPSSPPPTP